MLQPYLVVLFNVINCGLFERQAQAPPCYHLVARRLCSFWHLSNETGLSEEKAWPEYHFQTLANSPLKSFQRRQVPRQKKRASAVRS